MSLVGDAPTNICSGSIHKRVTKLYAGCQPTVTFVLFLGLGLVVNKIYELSTDTSGVFCFSV